jgi:enamine deaminase RidA (YjgF/YER057c/UK114 family)
MGIEEKLKAMGLTLPPPREWPPNRMGAVRTGNLVFVSGHMPTDPALLVGKVGIAFTLEQGYLAARSTALNCFASVKALLGSLDKVKRVVKLLGFVNVSAGFCNPSAVIDGASDLILELWGEERGRHARSAVGMFELTRVQPVEIEMVLEVED